MSKIGSWVRDNKKALVYVAAGIGVPTLMHIGFDSKLFEGRSIYEMTDSVPRFINYGLTAFAFGKALQTKYEASTGISATPLEKIGLYACGAMTATGLWEGWENIGQFGPIHDALRYVFGDLAKTNFPGSGIESFTDAAYTVAGTTAGAAGREVLRKYAERIELD